MLILCTDFGPGGPYTGQLRNVLQREAPGVPVIPLFDDLAAGRVQAAAYLLPAYVAEFDPGSVFLCVVDPGVGTASREPVVLQADGRWYVGPDNGLFEIIARRARQTEWWSIDWRPPRLSVSFHGRDLFAPVAAWLARGEPPPGQVLPGSRAGTADWPDQLAELVYLDPFGNALTGLQAASLASTARLAVAGRQLRYARTFAEVPRGEPFWYGNANGLVEIAINQGNAAHTLGLAVGDPVEVT